MNKSTLEVRYVLYTVVCDDPYIHERTLVTYFGDDPSVDEVEEVIQNLMGANHEYDYAFVEKQYHCID